MIGVYLRDGVLTRLYGRRYHGEDRARFEVFELNRRERGALDAENGNRDLIYLPDPARGGLPRSFSRQVSGRGI